MSKSGDWFLRTNPNDDVYDSPVDDGYEGYVRGARKEAEQHVMNWFNQIKDETMASLSPDTKVQNVDNLVYDDTRFHNAIWHSSTEILPHLEVQVVIDGKNNCYVTTGSAGYVEFGMTPPVGMVLPIRCWIHTHPFGSAYFSGTDIRTVSNWQTYMQEAYVLGSADDRGHYGYWSRDNPRQLEIYDYKEYARTQTWGERGNVILSGEEE